MRYENVRTTVPILAMLVALLGGCGRSAPTRFYVLTSSLGSEQKASAQASAEQLAIRIGPVEFPKYLDRPQMVSATSGNRLKVAEFDRWAEPLEESFTRVLTENLSNLLSTERIVLFPWKGGGPVDFWITVKVLRFDGTSRGEVLLIARWTILGPDENELTPPRRSRISVSTRGTGYEGVAVAMSEALGQLSREIVTEISAHR